MAHLTDTEDGRKALQQALKDHTFYDGDIDGDLGPKSKTAIRNARASFGLGSELIVDDALVAALGITYPTSKGKNVNTVLANVKSAWASKVNWTLAVTFVLNAMAFFGIAIPADVKDAVMMAVSSLGIIIAWIIKTWFTQSISAASAKKM